MLEGVPLEYRTQVLEDNCWSGTSEEQEDGSEGNRFLMYSLFNTLRTGYLKI
jgi:hypothetical protein